MPYNISEDPATLRLLSNTRTEEMFQHKMSVNICLTRQLTLLRYWLVDSFMHRSLDKGIKNKYGGEEEKFKSVGGRHEGCCLQISVMLGILLQP